MKINQSLFILVFLLSITSCESETDRIENELIGVWILDSVSSPRSLIDEVTIASHGNFQNYTDYEKIIFKENNEYILGWAHGDVDNVIHGKFYVLNNPGRGLKTITLLPDISTRNSDTIRNSYTNYDIVSLDQERLQVVFETVFVTGKNSSILRFNKNNIYKRLHE